MQRFGILGGTFNPVHRGHVIMAEAALAQAHLDQIVWVPAYAPPHRTTAELLAFEQRLTMVRLAIADQPQFTVSTVEREHPNPSYAIDTLHQLQLDYPHRHWHWIIGLDAFQTLPKWYKHAELTAECDWLIAPRPANQPITQPPDQRTCDDACEQVVQHLAAEGITPRWRVLQMSHIDISSSLIRQYCRDRRSIRDLVPSVVNAHIISHGLYQPFI